MPINNNPTFVVAGNLSSDNATAMAPTLTTAAADYTGVSANNQLVHTAGGNGSYVKKLRFVALGTNVATVARIYINNGSTNTTASNNTMMGQISLPATTASAVASTAEPEYQMELPFPAGWRVFVGLGTTVAAGWRVVPIAGNY